MDIIFHHCYATINTVNHKIEQISYFANVDEVEQVQLKSPLSLKIICCDNYDCRVGDIVYNNRIYREQEDGSFLWIKKGVKY